MGQESGTPAVIEIFVTSENRLPIREHIWLLPDPKGDYTLGELTSPSADLPWQLLGGVPNLDFKDAQAYWLRLQLDIPMRQNWYMGLELPLIDRIDLYRPFSEGGHEQVSAGYGLPFSVREVPHHLFFFELRQSGTYYLRVQSRARALVPLFAMDAYNFKHFALWENFVQGAFYGFLGLMFFIAFFLYFSSGRRSLYLFYALFIVGNLLVQGYISGFAHAYLFPESPEWYNTFNLAMVSSLTSFFHLWFGIYFLGKKLLLRLPRVRYLLGVVMALLLAVQLLSWTPWRGLAYELMSVASFTSNLSLLGLSIWMIRRRYSAQLLVFLLGHSIFVVGYTFVFAVYLELVAYFSFVTYISELSSIGEVICFTLALMMQMAQFRKEKQIAQSRLLSMTRNQSQRLEDRVRERTEELRQRNEEMLAQNEELRQQQEEMLAQRDLIEEQKQSLEARNVQITDSIRYARSIQYALLPNQNRLQTAITDHFVIYRPRDMVSGDFYWLYDKHPDYYFLAVIDCTGHGVPGAFMSVMANEALNYILLLEQLSDPALILEKLDAVITENLLEKQNSQDDGMVLNLLRLPKDTSRDATLVMAAAWQDAYHWDGHELHVLAPTRRGIGSGGGHRQRAVPFENIQLRIQPGQTLYLSTDGLKDQHDRLGNKLGKRRFQALLEEAATLPFAEQHRFIEYALERHQGSTKQRDDITLIGLLF